ncbi:hypothetical protein BDA99DRAFT_506100 [Phascolomyces articulosus]|uniref:Uncharacterized protein n=1 Tax=Phascolomyces articulosus TaxID=60185 RepID=A0AAD5PF82_9FUNG|nr:hypothetical protein BDA99DRAFT_506100 [Phascolomyces articulosus]
MKYSLTLLVLTVLALIFSMTPQAEAGAISCDCHCYQSAVHKYNSCRADHKTKKWCRSISGLGNCGTGCSIPLCNGDYDDSVSGSF